MQYASAGRHPRSETSTIYGTLAVCRERSNYFYVEPASFPPSVNTSYSPRFLILAGGIGYNLGERKAGISVTGDKRVVINQELPSDTSPVDFSLFWDVWQRMFRYYIDASGLDTQKMVWGSYLRYGRFCG